MSQHNKAKESKGWLGKFINKVSGASPIGLTFAPSVPVLESSNFPGINEPIIRDECYIELYLESLRLSKARKFANKFNGVVYSFVNVVREGEEDAQIAAFSKPSKLADLDDTSLDKLITVSKQMMGPTAFRGNPVSLELGLFSVKSGNVLTPVLDYVSNVSSTAGISFVGAVKPFLPLITEGMDLIAGQTKDTILEVGFDSDVSLSTGNVLAIINKPKGTINNKSLLLAADNTLLYKGAPIDCGYAVFSIRPRPDKPDFGEIPDLKERYSQFQSAILSGKAKEARDAMASFRFAVIASPDLIPRDAKNLIKKAKEKLEWAFPPMGKAAYGHEQKFETLAEIGLYE